MNSGETRKVFDLVAESSVDKSIEIDTDLFTSTSLEQFASYEIPTEDFKSTALAGSSGENISASSSLEQYADYQLQAADIKNTELAFNVKNISDDDFLANLMNGDRILSTYCKSSF